jgi:hypothetical protein
MVGSRFGDNFIVIATIYRGLDLETVPISYLEFWVFHPQGSSAEEICPFPQKLITAKILVMCPTIYRPKLEKRDFGR